MNLFSFDEDALAGAFLGRLHHGVELAVGNGSKTFRTARVREDLVALFHVREPVVEKREDVGSDLLTETIAGAEILVDPDLHPSVLTFGRRGSRGGGCRQMHSHGRHPG